VIFLLSEQHIQNTPRKIYHTAGSTFARLNDAVPVWLADAAWKMAAATREPMGRTLTSGLSRSRQMTSMVSRKFSATRMAARIQVAVLGKEECSIAGGGR
jgi:hypothetical protein